MRLDHHFYVTMYLSSDCGMLNVSCIPRQVDTGHVSHQVLEMIKQSSSQARSPGGGTIVAAVLPYDCGEKLQLCMARNLSPFRSDCCNATMRPRALTSRCHFQVMAWVDFFLQIQVAIYLRVYVAIYKLLVVAILCGLQDKGLCLEDGPSEMRTQMALISQTRK